ncbi:hypothetical protein [Salinivibrio sp. IB643]|uniref:hypothetical protein n=1 Tax=Salinivibrio sp. IB643 TaxID=1909445 RepID=UPI00098949BF|nr:hypothetical protein [Salinivibrio sp. IB643]OOE98484.1 hypothetical protein BZG77_06410 [Salinivibrio sp. IB643]
MALVDRVMLNELDALFSFPPQDIWNNQYVLQDHPIILVSKKKWNIYSTIFIVNKPDNYDSVWLKKVDTSPYQNISNLYSTRWYDLSTLLWRFIANFTNTMIEGKDALVFYYSEGSFLINDNRGAGFSQFMSHEAFHLYHQKRWNYDQNGNEFIAQYPHNHEHYQLLAREMTLLDQALDNLSDKNVLKSTLRDWVAIREKRYQQWPQLVAETNSETMEGTATYVELKPFLLYYDEMFVPAANDTVLSFNDYFNWIISSNNHHLLERRMSYEKGLALCLILDQLSETWKQTLGENAPTLYALIKTRVVTSEQAYQVSGTNK